MNFLRKIFNGLFGKKKEKIETSPPPKEDLALIRISTKKYPKATLSRDTYHIMLDMDTKKIYITPDTRSKTLLSAVKEGNRLSKETETKRLDLVSIGIIQARMYDRLYPIFQTGIFKDKDTQIQIYPIEEEQIL